MHIIQNGAAKISLISQVPVIPAIMEYIEVNDLVESDAQLFKKCIIRFGKPIYLSYNNDLIGESRSIRNAMSNIRKDIWTDFKINRDSIEDIDPIMYVNHTYAKKFKALGFTFDSETEQKYLLFDSESKESEYRIDENGEFKPGIITKRLRK